MKSPRKATTAIENASDKQDPATSFTCIGTGSCFEMRTKCIVGGLCGSDLSGLSTGLIWIAIE